jgi:hypothetical protein
MTYQLAKLALGRQVHALKNRLEADPTPPVTYRSHLLCILADVEEVLADDRSDRQALKRSSYWLLNTVMSDWSLARSAFGQELLVISGRVQKLDASAATRRALPPPVDPEL